MGFLRHLTPAGLLALAACVPATPAPPAPSPSIHLIASLPSAAPDATPVPGAELQGPLLLFEDFESGVEAWEFPVLAGRPGWQRIQSFSCGGAYTVLLGQGLDQRFSGHTGVSYLVYKPGLDLTTMKRPTLKYDVMGTVTPPEAVRVQPEVRLPGGEWQPAGPYAEGNHPIVDLFAADLTPFKGQKVELRFNGIFTPTATPIYGLQIDDVRLVEPRDKPVPVPAPSK